MDALEEAIEVMHRIWGSERLEGHVSFSGTTYSLQDAEPGPRPTHRIPIWLGALKPRMLRLTGRLADGLSISHNWIEPERVPEVQQTIDEAAQQAGRNVNEIRRLYNVMGIISPPDSHIRPKQPGFIIGSVLEWAETLAGFYKELAMDTFIFWPIAGSAHEQIHRYIYEVIPCVREILQADTGGI